MPEFQSMFMKSRGQPIEYLGKTLVLGDFFPTEGAHKFRLVLESCNGTWRQGVALDLIYEDGKNKWQKGAARGCDGQFVVFGGTYNGRKGIFFWRDEVAESVEFEVPGEVSVIHLFNVWDGGDGVMDSRHNGAAMIVEEIPNGRRYRCNDGEADDDFDDIVFRLERVK